jgi:membrane protein YqaA with SNARE-associated domain
MSFFVEVLSRRRGTHEWDVVLRATGGLALLAIYPATRWPSIAGLIGFLCLTLFVSGPISVVLPAAFEPMLMVAGRMYPPLIVALVAVAGNLYMDYVNYHVYGAALQHPRLERARNSALVQRLLVLFQQRPFFAVWLCAWSPIPYWVVAALAPLARYSMKKFLLATFLGRGPRVWFFAALGLVVPVATQTLVVYVVAAIAVGVVVATYQRSRATAARPAPLNERRLICGSLP